MGKIITAKCFKCGADVKLSYDSFYYRNRNNKPILCDTCYHSYRSEVAKQTWAHKTKEEIELTNLKKSKSAKSYWNKLSDNAKQKHLKRIYQDHHNWLKNLSDEDKQVFKDRMHDMWESKSEEEKIQEINRLRKMSETYRNNMTDEDRKKIKNKQIKYWNSLPTEAKKQWADMSKKRWDNMSDSYRKDFIRKRIMEASNHNKLHKCFEKIFSDSNLMQSLHYVSEYPTTNNGVTHCWDYGVFDENSELIAVVDLDGAYFHADGRYDYDGIHSKYEYDIKRGQSIPESIIHCIIREENINDDFKWLAYILTLSYDQYVQEEVRYLASQPFPHQYYSDTDLVHSWDKLEHMNPNSKYYSSNNQCHLGDHLVYHFCHSLYDEKIWTKEWIEEAIRSHMIYHPHMNKNKLLMCVPHEEFTPPGHARILLKDHNGEYVDNEIDIGMMIGCIASGISYKSNCTNISRWNEVNMMLEWLTSHGISYKININDHQLNY